MEFILRLDSVSKIWDNSVIALSEVSLNIKEGSIVSIVGKSGTGKTTLLKIISGLIKPTKGEVYFNSKSVASPIPDISMVFQDYVRSLLPWRNVIKNVTLPLENSQLNRFAKSDIAMKALQIVGMETFAYGYPNELSGGMQQRVVIARSIAQKAKILLLDEPFSALDTVTKYNLQIEFFKIWKSYNLTVLIVSHDIEDAIFMSDRVLVLNKSNPSIVSEFEVSLPHPRNHLTTRSDAEFIRLRIEILSLLFR